MRPKRILAAAGVMLLVCASGFAQKQEKAQTPAKSGAAPAKPAEAKKPRARVVTDLSGFDLLESGKVRTQTQVPGATRGMARPIPLAPRLGKLYGDRPTFSWMFEGKAKNFLFLLQDDARNELFHAEVTGYEYRYPATAPALEPGKTYFWTVEVASAMLGEPSAPAGFLVLNPAQRAEVGNDLRAAASPWTPPTAAMTSAGYAYLQGLARARAFRDHRLWYDALDAYSGLIARYPDRAELYEERGTIYAQLEATKALAEQDFARADQIREHSASR